MAEIITCPACQRKLQVPESFYGQTVQCPECAQKFVADPHAQSVQAPKASAGAPPAPAYDDRPRRRREFIDEDDEDEFDDDIRRGRPLRRSGIPHRGGVILALGIISLVIFPWASIICGPLAWLLGNADLSEIRAGRMDESGEGMVQAGRVLGIISTVMMLGFVLIICAVFGLAFVTRR